MLAGSKKNTMSTENSCVQGGDKYIDIKVTLNLFKIKAVIDQTACRW